MPYIDSFIKIANKYLISESLYQKKKCIFKFGINRALKTFLFK